MMIPSIDIQNGQAVQLVGGRDLAVAAGDPFPIAERFARSGEIALIDLDAAMGTGSNAGLLRELCALYPCRVGGGIRDARTALDWLDAGARRVILGTAATPEVLSRLPRDRVIAALDARHDRVVVDGWQTQTALTVEERMRELAPLVGGFLVTFVEHEGRMGGLDIERVRRLVALAGDARLTAAGGVSRPEDIALADAVGADAQVGMALYTGAFDLSDGLCAPLVSDRPDGLWPTLVCDERGRTLGLVYSNRESVHASIESGEGVYHSRSRGGLWRKGATSGNTQRLVRIEPDCDRDALRFTVRQGGSGFCHTGTESCFGGLGEIGGLARLERTLRDRIERAPEGSYTRRLLDDPALLGAKLREECDELLAATTREEAAHEGADVIFFALTRALRGGATLEDIERELDRRARKVTRRPGDAKPAYTAAGGEGS